MRAVATITALAVAGCSFAFVKSAPSEAEPQHWPRCTEAPMWPIADTAYAGLSIGMIAAIAHDDDDWASLGYIVAVPLAIGLGLSAISGWSRTSKCTAARAAYEKAAAEGR